MGTTADIQKLVERMARAKGLVDRAAHDSDKHEAVMDRFESRLNNLNDHFGKIDEYEKQLAAMEQMGNGGPPITDTFQSATGGHPKEPTTAADHTYTGKIDPGTGDQRK